MGRGNERFFHGIVFFTGLSKMVATPIYGKNPSKLFSRTGGLISSKLGM